MKQYKHRLESLLLAATTIAFLATSQQLSASIFESKNSAQSPDKSQTFRVERLSDYNDPFSGKMMLQLSSNSDPNSIKQRLVEGTRIRTMTPPVWLNNEWVGFSYNVGKNSEGYTYYHAPSHKTILIETDIVRQLMGNTGQVEEEMQNLSFTQYTDKKSASLQIQNLTWGSGNRSLFPLYLPTINNTARDTVPGLPFLKSVESALSEYQGLCELYHAKSILPELGTESFDQQGDRVAFLAAMETTPTLVVLPLSAKTAQDAFKKAMIVQLPSMIRLSSTSETDTEVATEDTEDLTAVRFTTKWGAKGATIIGQEVYDEINNTTQLQPYCEVDKQGHCSILTIPVWPGTKDDAETTK